jgi:hypothetical protein
MQAILPEFTIGRALAPTAGQSTLRAADYSLAISIGAGREVNPPEICDAIRNAATTAGRLISLRN